MTHTLVRLAESVEKGNSTELERRSTRRFDVSLPVRTSNPLSGSVVGVTRDLSLGGVYLFVENGSWNPGGSIEYVLQLPAGLTLADAMWVMCFGTICRVDVVGERLGIAVKVDCLEVLERR